MAIRKELAQQLTERLVEHFSCDINIYDNKGIVTAGSDKSQVGVYAESVSKLIKESAGKKQRVEESGIPSSLQEGELCIPLFCGEEVIGAVQLIGKPEVLTCITWAVKTSIETVMDYECYKEALLRRQDTKNQFFSRLLYHYVQDQREIEDFAMKLGYKKDIIRVPILFQLPSHQYSMDILAAVKSNPAHDKQHMTFITTDSDLIVFKPVAKEGKYLFRRLRNEVIAYIEAARRNIVQEGLKEPEAYYVGSYQEHFIQYKDSYRHTMWLISQVKKKKYRENSGIYFFYDYVMQYLFDSIPVSYFSQIFPFINHYLDRSTKNMLISTIEALMQNNMSIKAAAEELNVHRNTISFRLEKFREQLGLDPMNKAADVQLMFMLVEYLKVTCRTETENTGDASWESS